MFSCLRKLFVLRDCTKKTGATVSRTVIGHILICAAAKEAKGDDADLIVMDVENTENMCEKWQSVLHFAMQMCRKHGLIKDRITLVSPSDFLQIVQLCQAQVQKEMGKGFVADSGDQLLTLARAVYSRKQARAVAEVTAALSSPSSPHTEGSTDADTDCKSSPACTPQEDVKTPRPSKTSGSHDNDQKTPTGQGVTETLSSEGVEVDTSILAPKVLEEYDRFMVSSNHVDSVDVLRTFLLELAKDDHDPDLLSVHLPGTDHTPELDRLQEQVIKVLASRKAQGTSPKAKSSMVTVKGTALWPALPSLRGETEGETQGETEREAEPQAEDQVTEADMLEEVVREVVVSYLHLLVNTRSELALARVFNSPDRGLTHHAFTCLRHLATSKHMSLYQTAASVMMKIRLGGSGYALDPNHQLLSHVKGLGHLLDTVDTLQQVIEDTPCVRTSVQRAVGVVRKRLVTCKSGRFRRERVEGVVSRIQVQLGSVVDRLDGRSLLVSPDKPASEGGSLTSRRPRRVLLHYLDELSLQQWTTSTSTSPQHRHHHLHTTWLQDIPFGPHTPSRFPCVLSQFRSPVVDSVASPVSKNKANNQGTPRRKRKMTVGTNRLQDGIDQTLLERCSKRLCDTVIVLPSKTIVHPAASTTTILPTVSSKEVKQACGDKENLKHPFPDPRPHSPRSDLNTKGRQQPAAKGNNSSSAPLAEKKSAMPEKGDKRQTVTGRRPVAAGKAAGKKCRRRLLSPGKGQRAITSFFRV